MRYPVTPGEFDRLLNQLRPLALPEDRVASIARMVFEAVADCPLCERPIRRCDRRRLVGEQLFHLSCACDAGSARREGLEGEGVTGRL